MIEKVKFFWETPTDPELIRQAAVSAYGMEENPDKWHSLWRWRFEDNPLSDRIHAAYIFENGKIACFYAISPLTLIDGGRPIKAGLAIWGFTHPEFQGKGYYSLMYQATQSKLADLGFDCLLAFDNHNSHYPEVKYLGWKDIGLLTTFSLDCRIMSKPCDLLPGQNVTWVDLSDELLSTLASFRTNDARFHIERGFDCLKWRLLDNPINSYRALVLSQDNAEIAAIAYKRYGSSEIDIMESFFREDDESGRFDSTRILLSELAKTEGISQLNIWSQLLSSEHLLLEKIGFIERYFSSYFVCHPMRLSTDILDLGNWHYRFIDSDVY